MKQTPKRKVAINLRKVSKTFKDTVAVDNVNMKVYDGEFLVILGPSGCGKTSLLRVICGLVGQDSGHVFFGKKLIDDIIPQERDIGFIFQNYTLFKHMSIQKNVEFGLRIKGAPKEERVSKAQKLLDLVGLPDIGDKLPKQLSGGQQQRIALARALAPNPHILLLDEPLGALDIKTRQRLRADIKEIQRELGITAVLVTHDQEEAFELGDRVAVMNNGKIEHVGTPQEIYDHPQTEFVASFIGTVNVLPARVVEGRVKLGYLLLDTNGKNFKEDEQVKVLIRPENIDVEKTIVEVEKKEEVTTGKILDIMFLGPVVKIRISLGRGISVFATKSKTEVLEKKFKTGDDVFVTINKYRIFPEAAEVLITVPLTKVLKI